MPTILIFEGFRFYFFSDEGHEPPHVHVKKGDMMAKIWLSPVSFSDAAGVKPAQRKRILRIVKEHRNAFIETWRNHFSS